MIRYVVSCKKQTCAMFTCFKKMNSYLPRPCDRQYKELVYCFGLKSHISHAVVISIINKPDHIRQKVK